MEDTKQRILEKSLELFSTKGYDAVSVGEIAKAVGIKAPSLYNHFPSKQAIFDAIVESTAAHYEKDTGRTDIQDKNGVCILCAEGRKREFLADPKFLTHKGFKVSDISDCGINLMYLPLAESAQPPKFKACAKHPKVEENGFVLYYTDQCPYTYYWVPKVQKAAEEHGIPFKAIHITEKEMAQNVPAPVTTYALFRDGKFVTQSIQSDKKFLKLAGAAD